jgi:hypothetical protein
LMRGCGAVEAHREQTVLPGITGAYNAAPEACQRMETIRSAKETELEIGGADAWSSAGRCQACIRLGKL